MLELCIEAHPVLMLGGSTGGGTAFGRACGKMGYVTGMTVEVERLACTGHEKFWDNET